jgi:hypothetical protein
MRKKAEITDVPEHEGWIAPSLAAEWLGISRQAMNKQIKTGTLHAERIPTIGNGGVAQLIVRTDDVLKQLGSRPHVVTVPSTAPGETIADSVPTPTRTWHAQQMAEWFQGRTWRVRTERISETAEVSVRRGEFWAKNGAVVRTPLGNKARHGYILQEVDPETGADIGPEALFGWVIISNAAEMFPGSIAEVPRRPYGQRGGVAGKLAS